MLLWGRAVICRLGLPVTALAHTALAATIAVRVARGETPSELGGLLAPDALGVLFLMLASLLFLAASFYAVKKNASANIPTFWITGASPMRRNAASQPACVFFSEP